MSLDIGIGEAYFKSSGGRVETTSYSEPWMRMKNASVLYEVPS